MLKLSKSTLAIKILFLLIFILTPKSAYAQEAPFRLNILHPFHEGGKITYQVVFYKTVEWNMADVTIKIPIPEGTRFLESNAISSIETTFDGKEVTFFIPVLQDINKGDALFTVEITDPMMTVFTTNAWISWKGDYPGDYLTDEEAIDILKTPLNWHRPPQSDLQLELTATVDDEIITYYIYPRKTSRSGIRMWDARINVPVPEGTTFLSAEASPPFVSDFDGQEVSFFAIELASEADIGPLSFKVSVEDVTEPHITTHAWAVWKNSNRRVGTDIIFQEETRTGDIITQLDNPQSVVSDVIGDVPFPDYDITSIAIQEDASALKINFYVAGALDGALEEPLVFILYIDSDCQSDTGQLRTYRGAEHFVRYRYNEGQADIRTWDEKSETWLRNDELAQLNNLVDENQLTIWAPNDFFAGNSGFCWEGLARIDTQEFDPKPPEDVVVGGEISGLTQYNFTKPIVGSNVDKTNMSEAQTHLPIAEPIILEDGYLINYGENWRYLKGYGEASYPFTNWQNAVYQDTGWLEGLASIGYGNENVTTVLEDMQDNYVSVFMRQVFNVPDPAAVQSLILEIDYTDGFVAYLNGVEVARRNMAGEPGDLVSYDAEATTERIGDGIEVIDISNFGELLQPGKNVLAIQAHNNREFSTDFFVMPALRWKYIAGSLNDQASAFIPSDVIENTTINNIIEPDDTIQICEIEPEPEIATAPDITGKLAIPIDTGRVTYDTHIFSLPDGQEIAKIHNARQPDFRSDGQRMLINREGGGVENVFEYNFVDGTEIQVSDAPQDWHPVYDPWGNQVAYGNAELTTGRPEPLRNSSGGIVHSSHDTDIIYHTPKKPFIFVQCGLMPPHQETEHRCRDIPNLGVLIPAGRVGEIQGTHPVWTSNDMIAYKGCNTWLMGSQCGIYTVPSASTVGFSDGFIPRRLTKDTSDTPTDTKDNLIAFMSMRDGDWEAYVMDLNGNGLRNLSNSPETNDGLPTISPDGNWAAFVSDRGGQWAVWVTPTAGGSVQKLFDLPSNAPWGDGNRSWTNERISWGP